MAVTAIWHVSSRIGKALDYVMNPEKTVEKPENSPDAIAARKAVGDVLDYAENSDKTEKNDVRHRNQLHTRNCT